MKTALLAFAAALSAASAASAQPVGFHDLAAIDAALAAFTGAPVGMPGGAALPVDRRLRLAPCRGSLDLSWRGGRQETVIVQCPDAGGWRLFVAATGNGRQDAAALAIARGEAVTIAVSGEGFSVSQTGEAMEPGAIGAWIRVRTSARGDALRAQVVRPGLVSIPTD